MQHPITNWSELQRVLKQRASESQALFLLGCVGSFIHGTMIIEPGALQLAKDRHFTH